jgi:hypothetical protein
MLRNIKELEECSVAATDGMLGRVRDFYFEDDSWVIRYFVVEASYQEPRRRVLISPISVGLPNWSANRLPVNITREQVANSPDIDTDKPVSRQQEVGYLGYYGYGTYWGGGGLWGAGIYPDILQAGLQPHEPYASDGISERHDDPHLRSVNTVLRYYVHAMDGDLGHVQGLLVDDESWAIRYFIIDTSNWWLGHQVIVAPQWIDHLSWAESTLYVDLTRQAIKDSPPYDPTFPFDEDQATKLHAHYGRAAYSPGGTRDRAVGPP